LEGPARWPSWCRDESRCVGEEGRELEGFDLPLDWFRFRRPREDNTFGDFGKNRDGRTAAPPVSEANRISRENGGKP
jgi:hypothetical protein